MFGFHRIYSTTPFRLQQDARFGTVKSVRHDEALDGCISLMSQREGKSRPDIHLPVRTSIHPRRVRLGLGLVLVVGSLFIGRSAHLQIVRGEFYTNLSNHNRERIELTLPSRGLILDVTGETLAWNEPAFVLTMIPSQLPSGEERRALFDYVAARIGLQPTELDLLLGQYASRPTEAIPVVDELDYESAIRLAIDLANLSGFELVTSTKRIYTSSIPSVSHILGYTGALSEEDVQAHRDDGYRLIDSIGKTGVERQYETFLRGIPGKYVYEVDALGQELSILSKEDSVLGSNLTLSLHAEFQKYIETKLRATLDRLGISRGSVVAMDPMTGAIRALVSLPTFDANEFINGISTERYLSLIQAEDEPLFFRAIAGEFPSGSTFKPVVAYAALAEGIVDEHDSFVSMGGLRVGEWFFPDWKTGGHGVTDIRKAIAESVNTYFYIIGGGFDTFEGLGVDRIVEYARRFGFGQMTGIDLPGEADGFLPSKEWKESTKAESWYVGDTYHLSIGQGDFLTTPLQMAVATATIANGGFKVTPYVVEQADGFGANFIDHIPPEEMDGLDQDALSIVRQGMRQVVTVGSARSLSNLSEEVAGKTGTAQTPGNKPYHSWFTGFGPYEDPSLALVVLIEEGGESTNAAVPLARDIFEWWLSRGEDM